MSTWEWLPWRQLVYRVPASVILTLGFVVAVVLVGPVWLAWAELADEERFPHPGELMGVFLAVAVY